MRTVEHGGHASLHAKTLAFTAINLKTRFSDLVCIAFLLGLWQTNPLNQIRRFLDFTFHLDWSEVEGISNTIHKLVSIAENYINDLNRRPPKRISLSIEDAYE